MTRRKIKIKAHAKINLSLNILGRSKGMHLLDMVMASVGTADVITAVERFDSNVFIDFINPDGTAFAPDGFDKNNTTVHKAVEIIKRFAGGFGADIIIEKNIPVSGGMGGSGVDAAGVICALDRFHGLKKRGLDLERAAHMIGSDVPYQLTGGFKRVSKSGENLSEIKSSLEFNIVFASKGKRILSGDSYRKFDELYPSFSLIPSDNDVLTSALERGDRATVLKEIGNALYPASLALEPTLKDTLDALYGCGAEKAFMTGSGDVCIGIFPDNDSANKAAEILCGNGYTAKADKTAKSGIEIKEY